MGSAGRDGGASGYREPRCILQQDFLRRAVGSRAACTSWPPVPREVSDIEAHGTPCLVGSLPSSFTGVGVGAGVRGGRRTWRAVGGERTA